MENENASKGKQGKVVDCFTEIMEGSTKFHLPEYRDTKGPSSKDMQVFYNPVMSLNRDFSVLFFSNMSGIEKALDGLAASGARGIRVVHETQFPGEMVLNDYSPAAAKIMKMNMQLNQLQMRIETRNLKTLLTQEYYDYIDIDPFGSPVEFSPLAMTAVRNKGFLAITATDTGALCGSYPKAGLRRYGFRNRKGPCLHETGLRGFLGYLVKQAAKVDRYIEPVLSQSIDHYYRVHIRIRNGARKADKMLSDLGYLRYNGIRNELLRNEEIFKSRERNTDIHKGNDIIGPFYLGPLHDSSLLLSFQQTIQQQTLRNTEKVRNLVEIYTGENPLPPFYFDTDRISSFLKRSSPRLDSLIRKLEHHGYRSSRTQFSQTGLKTEADVDTIVKIFSSL